MKVYKVEVFDNTIAYKSSCQIDEIEYAYDYLDIEKNKVKVYKIKADKGDYIRIKRGNLEFCGVISDVVTKKGQYEISFKPFSNYFDVKAYMDAEKNSGKTIEKGIADIVSDLYINNDDTLQNITGLEIQILSATQGTLLSDSGINNVYDIVLDMFTTYGVMCDFKINPQKRKLMLYIGTGTSKRFVIEADRNNIISKEITIKEAKESTNKLKIYNEEDFTQSIIYFKDKDDNITTQSDNRVTPVVFDCTTVKISTNTTFEEQALKKATSTLKATKYDNLIEIEVLNNDSLVRPLERKIGQEALIISNGIVYSTILTGLEIKDNTKLIFGAIRLELTKQIKRRWRKDEY